MARSNKISESPAPEFDLYDASPPPSGQGGRSSNVQPRSHSPSPATSVSSDKENRSSRGTVDKGKGRMPMGPPPNVPSPSVRQSGKRPAEEPSGGRERRRRTQESERESVEGDDNDEDLYNPDQPIEERRRTRAELRDLTRRLKEDRAELLVADDDQLLNSIIRANELTSNVKQTADATIDSTFLTSAADTVLAKTNALIAGDYHLTIDLDDFINKVRAFMRGGVPRDDDVTATQRQRNDEDEDNDGEILNWEYLGRECIQHIYRPSVPGFLLGPLSVQKRAKRAIQRKAPLRHKDMKETRPEVLQADDIERDENKNLVKLSTGILMRLHEVRKSAMEAAEARVRDDMTDAEAEVLKDEYGLSDEGGIALFKFLVNPHSFGQTIENMFYISFLIRDGNVGISTDDRGLPYLNITAKGQGDKSGRTKKDRGSGKHQAIIELDFATWKHLIDAFNIKEPMIPHREERDQSNVGSKGWYA